MEYTRHFLEPYTYVRMESINLIWFEVPLLPGLQLKWFHTYVRISSSSFRLSVVMEALCYTYAYVHTRMILIVPH